MQSLFFIHNGYRVIARFWTSIHRKTERNCSDCIACVVVQEDNYFKKLINIQESSYKNLFTAFFKRFKIKHP